MSNNFLKNRKGQISDIMTWVVATTIILIIIVVFIYASVLLGQKTKILNSERFAVSLGEDVDLIGTKNSLAYSESSDEHKEIIENFNLEEKNEDSGE